MRYVPKILFWCKCCTDGCNKSLAVYVNTRTIMKNVQKMCIFAELGQYVSAIAQIIFTKLAYV